ncbi:MAG: dipeptide/oligopeptide/nickel ABC transporter ATP-binding protein [Gaiellaceae bacterium]|nr:MAG: dipeptide/oligopeptide/nickel ABC transporter ATP-binding protein [Gaiellaceae bacterium]
MTSALEVQGLTVRFRTPGGWLTAVEDVSLVVPTGGTLGLVGESGCGKSTAARAIVGLARATAGHVRLHGKTLELDRQGIAAIRREVQLVFQNPYGSLNPRSTVQRMLSEAVATVADEADRYSPADLLDLVSLPRRFADCFPHQLSGGERQRVAIARALAVRPSVVIADEITSALDVSVQASILNLLIELQETIGLSYLLISHNLGVVSYLSDRITVMYLGRVLEEGPARQLLLAPSHPYTKALLEAAPTRLSRRESPLSLLDGELPDPRHPPAGCVFHTRCPIGPRKYPGRERCAEEAPTLQVPGRGGRDQRTRCHFPLEAPATTLSATRARS